MKRAIDWATKETDRVRAVALPVGFSPEIKARYTAVQKGIYVESSIIQMNKSKMKLVKGEAALTRRAAR